MGKIKYGLVDGVYYNPSAAQSKVTPELLDQIFGSKKSWFKDKKGEGDFLSTAKGFADGSAEVEHDAIVGTDQTREVAPLVMPDIETSTAKEIKDKEAAEAEYASFISEHEAKAKSTRKPTDVERDELIGIVGRGVEILKRHIASGADSTKLREFLGKLEKVIKKNKSDFKLVLPEIPKKKTAKEAGVKLADLTAYTRKKGHAKLDVDKASPEDLVAYMKTASELLIKFKDVELSAPAQKAYDEIAKKLEAIQKRLIAEFNAEFGAISSNIDNPEITREYLLKYKDAALALLQKFEGVKLSPSVVAAIDKIKENLQKVHDKTTQKYTTRSSQSIVELTPDQLREMGDASGFVRFEDIFRLSSTSRATLIVRSVISTALGQQFDEAQTLGLEEKLKDENKSLVDLLFVHKEIEIDGTKKKVYVLTDEYKDSLDMASFADMMGYKSVTAADGSIVYYSEKKPTLTYSGIVEKASSEIKPVTRENITKFKTALESNSEIFNNNITKFIGDVLDKTGIANTFGSGLQQYNEFADVPVPVLAMHAVMSTGVLDLLTDVDGSLPENKHKDYRNIVNYLRANGQEVLAELVVQIVGYDVTPEGKVVPLSKENDKFATQRAESLPTILTHAKASVDRATLMSENYVKNAKGVAVVQSVLREKGFFGDPAQIAVQREKYIRENMLSNPQINPRLGEIILKLNAADATARLSLLDTAQRQRKKDLIDSLEGQYGDRVPETFWKGARESIEKPKTEKYSVVVENIALISSIQSGLEGRLTGLNPGDRAAAYNEYQQQEAAILSLNYAYLDIMDAQEEADLTFSVINEVKVYSLSEMGKPGSELSKKQTELAGNRSKEVVLKNRTDFLEGTAIPEAQQQVNDSIVAYYKDSLRTNLNTIKDTYVSRYGAFKEFDIDKFIEKAVTSLSTAAWQDGIFSLDKLQQKFEENIVKFIQKINDLYLESSIPTPYADPKKSAKEAVNGVNGAYKGIIELSGPDRETELKRLLGLPDTASVVEFDATDTDIKVKGTTETAITQAIDGIKNPEERKKARLLYSLVKQDKIAAQHKTTSEELQDVSVKVKQIEMEVSSLVVKTIRVEEFSQKLSTAEKLLERLLVCRHKVEKIDVSQFTEDNLKALGFNTEQIEQLMKADVAKLKETLIADIDERIQKAREIVSQIRTDMARDHGIMETIDASTGVRTFANVDVLAIATGFPKYDINLTNEAAIKEEDLKEFYVGAVKALQKLESDEYKSVRDFIEKHEAYIKLKADIERARKIAKSKGVNLDEPDAPTPEEVINSKITGLTTGTINIDKATSISDLEAFIKEAEALLLEFDNDARLKPVADASAEVAQLKAKIEKAKLKVEDLKRTQTPEEQINNRISGLSIVVATASLDDLTEFIRQTEEVLALIDADPKLKPVAEKMPTIIKLKKTLEKARERKIELEKGPLPFSAELAKKESAALLSLDIETIKADAETMKSYLEKITELIVKIKDLKDKSLDPIVQQLQERKRETIIAKTPEDVRDFVDHFDRIALIREYEDSDDPVRKTEILLSLGYKKSEILPDGNLPPTDDRVEASHDESVRILKEHIKPRIPTDPTARDQFIEDAVEYELSDEPDADDARRAEVRDNFSQGIDKIDTMETINHSAPAFEEGDDLEGATPLKTPSLKKTKPSSKGVQLALKSVNELIVKVQKKKAAAKAYAAHVKEQTKTSVLEQAYAKLLFGVFSTEMASMTATVDPAQADKYGKEPYAETGGNEAFDAFIVLKYLNGFSTSVVNPTNGKLGRPEYNSEGEIVDYQYIDEFIYQAIEKASKPKAKLDRRQKTLHKHLHTLATREAIAAGAKKLEEFCVKNGISIDAETLELLVTGKYMVKDKDGVTDIPLTIPEEIVTPIRTEVKKVMGKGSEM